MKNISKLLASSVVLLAVSMVSAPLMAANGTESFNLVINADDTTDNTLILSSSISANNTFNGDGTDYPLVGEMNLTGFNILENKCRLSFSSENESDTSFRMKNDAEVPQFVDYALSVNLLKNNTGNTNARLLNRAGVGTTRAVVTDIDAEKGCSLTLSDFTVKLQQSADTLTGIYRDTVTVTASVIS